MTVRFKDKALTGGHARHFYAWESHHFVGSPLYMMSRTLTALGFCHILLLRVPASSNLPGLLSVVSTNPDSEVRRYVDLGHGQHCHTSTGLYDLGVLSHFTVSICYTCKLRPRLALCVLGSISIEPISLNAEVQKSTGPADTRIRLWPYR